jgi:hypothetical protein
MEDRVNANNGHTPGKHLECTTPTPLSSRILALPAGSPGGDCPFLKRWMNKHC